MGSASTSAPATRLSARGCQLIDIYRALAAQGVTVPAGSCPSVGVSGVTLGGGMGLAARNFGMTTDNVIGVQIVTPDGRLRQVNSRNNSDLFWALRGGGGGNFGVVTQFTFRIHPIPSTATYFNVEFPWSQATTAIEAWQSWAPHTTTKITSILHVNGGSGGGSINANGQFFGSPSQLRGLIGPLLSVPGAQLQTNISLGYFPLQMLLAGCSQKSFPQCHTVGTFPGANMPRLPFRAGSDYVGKPLSASRSPSGGQRRRSIGRGRWRAAVRLLRRRDQPGTPERDRLRSPQPAVLHPVLRRQQRRQLGQPGARDMHPYVSGQSYQNYIDKNLEHWQQAYYGSNYKRLQQIRKKYDPHHFFNFPQAIGR